MQELYAAWGTTRAEHMARMLNLVARLNARVADADEDEYAETEAMVESAVAVCDRAVIRRPSTVAGRLFFSKRTVIKNGADGRRFADAWYETKKRIVNRPVVEINGEWFEVVKNTKDGFMILKTEGGKLVKLRKRSGKPVRYIETKSIKDRRRKK